MCVECQQRVPLSQWMNSCLFFGLFLFVRLVVGFILLFALNSLTCVTGERVAVPVRGNGLAAVRLVAAMEQG